MLPVSGLSCPHCAAVAVEVLGPNVHMGTRVHCVL